MRDGFLAIPVVVSLAAAAAEPVDLGTTEALRSFERGVHAVYARELARARARDGSADDGPEAPPALPLPSTARLRLRGVLDRMALSVGWQVEQDSWSAGIRLRYSRAVEFDAATQSYALVEARELTPAASFRIVALSRSTRVVVRRTGYTAWEGALFAPPSGWLFFDRPDRAAEAEELAPGTAITLSNELKVFAGANVATDVGALPLRVRAGAFASGEYFVRLERLPPGNGPPDPREWVVSVGGLIPRGFDSALNLRTPDLLWGKRLRLVEAHWRLPTGVRFLLRAGPLDLRGDPETASFLRTAMAGGATYRFADARLLAANLRVIGTHPELGPELLKRVEHFPNFERLLAAAREDPEKIPYSESMSRFTPRAQGEAGLGLWAFLYGFDLTSNGYAEKSLGAPSGRPLSLIFSYPLQRRWDRGWLFFPRETQDLQMLTVDEGDGGDRITELSLEVEDAHAHRRESLAYREQVRGVLTPPVAGHFPTRADTESPGGPRALAGELPELSRAPEEEERVSIYLRVILGPRFHERLLLGAKDAEERKDRITEFQKRLSRSVRQRGDALEELVATYGTDDLFVSYRIALTPYGRRKESPRPTTVFTGSFGDPERIPSYRRLRDLFDAAGTIF